MTKKIKAPSQSAIQTLMYAGLHLDPSEAAAWIRDHQIKKQKPTLIKNKKL